MRIKELSEVRLAQPAVDPRTELDTDRLRHHTRRAEPIGEIDLSEPALSEQPIDAIAEHRFGADEDLTGRDQARREIVDRGRSGGASGCVGKEHGEKRVRQVRQYDGYATYQPLPPRAPESLQDSRRSSRASRAPIRASPNQAVFHRDWDRDDPAEGGARGSRGPCPRCRAMRPNGAA